MKRLLPLVLVAMLPACRGGDASPDTTTSEAEAAAPRTLNLLLTSNGWGELEPCG